MIALVDDHDVKAPSVGIWRPAVKLGDVVKPGDHLGLLEVLGGAVKITAPPGARGVVTAIAAGASTRARVPVDHGALLYTLDPSVGVGAAEGATTAEHVDESGVVFRAPTSGRFYSRSSPDKPAFVSVGDVISPGQTVCLLEVMKTFNRVVYDGARATVRELAVADESDVTEGQVLLRLEAP